MGEEIKIEGMKIKFNKAYSNLPTDERDEIIVIIDGRPYTWNRTYDEINSNTELGIRILNKIHKMGLI